MSKRQPGCLSFLFGSCVRQKEKKRNAVSVEHLNINSNKEIATQTQDQLLRSSAPATFFQSAAHKPTIAVRDSNGFKVQNSTKDRLVIKNDEVSHVSIENPEDFESIRSDHNDDPLMSSKSIQRFFSPGSQGSSRVFPDPFKWDNSSAKPKLKPITPQLLFRKKLVPIPRPVKLVEKIGEGVNDNN